MRPESAKREGAKKGAIIGFGAAAAEAHVPAWRSRDDLRIAAVVESSPERRDLARELIPGARVVATVEELLRDARDLDLEFVDIATPPRLHAALASRALAAGLHVLCEKPLAVPDQDARGLCEEARRRDLALYCVDNWRHAPLFAEAARIARSGALGEIRHVELHTLRSRPAAGALPGAWRKDPAQSGGGILVDHGWHAVYLLMELADAVPDGACSRLRVLDGGVDEEALCLLDFPAATGTLYLTWRAGDRSNWGLVSGARGRLELRDDHLLISTSGQPARRVDFPEKVSAGSAHPSWFAAMLDDFASAMGERSSRERARTRAEACWAAVRALYRSHDLGGARIPIEQAASHPAGARA